MFTVNLKDIKLGAEFPDTQFANEDHSRLVEEAAAHITEKFPSSFPNPVTLQRKISEVVRDDSGLTPREAGDKRMVEMEAQIENDLKQQKSKTDPIREQYGKLLTLSQEKFTAERNLLLAQLSAASTEEDREVVQLKLDEHNYQADLDYDRILKEQNTAIEAVLVAYAN